MPDYAESALSSDMVPLLRTLGALALAATIAIPGRAAADCYAGGTPDWGDVWVVEVDRCQMTNLEYPCYHAVFAGAAGRGNGLDGFMIAYRFKGRTGQYTVRTTGPEFDQMVQLTRQADFFNLQVPDERSRAGSLATVMIDGPRDQVMIRRCNVDTAIKSGGDMHSDQYKRLVDLADRLTSIVSALPWQKKNDDSKDVEHYFLP